MIAIGCDHGGLNIKTAVIEYFKENGIEYTDYGCDTPESVDYPLYAYQVAKSVSDCSAQYGIICCGTGIGVSMTANKIKGIRAAVCTDEFCAEMTRRHNDANVLCMGGRVIDEAKAVQLADIFLHTDYEGGRHDKRVQMITDIENGNFVIKD